MNKKNNKRNSIIQLLLIFLVVILINYIISFLIFRVDLTSEGRYTLSKQTINLLENLDDQLYVKVYLEGNDLPIGFKRMRTALNDLLEEFSYYGNEDISFRFINPTENDDKNAKFGLWSELRKKGIHPIETEEVSDEGNTSQKLVFPSAIVVYKGKDIGVNLLKNDKNLNHGSDENINNSIQSMEYELTNAIRKLSFDKKPAIAFIEGQGELSEMEVMDISTSLSEYYEVKRGAINSTPGILDQFLAVIIAKPRKKFSENDKLVLDQYIMKGGKVLWLLDGAQINMDSLRQIPVTAAMPLDLGIADQLFRYGVRLNPGLLQDVQCERIGLTVQGSDGRPKINLFPWAHFPVVLTNNTHEVNKYLSPIRLEFPSSLDTVGASDNIKKTILLSSSNKAKFEYAPCQVSFEKIQKQIDPSDFISKNLPIAVLLEGKFDSNYKNRLLEKFIIPNDSIIKTSVPTKMIIVSDGDIAKNLISPKGEVYPLGYDMYSRQMFKGNSEFLINAINYLCDDEGLMSVRLREIKLRLLNKDKVKENKTMWKSLNVLIPSALVLIFGFISFYMRKRKYSRPW